MSRKAKIFIILIPVLIIMCLLGLYILLAEYYKSGFSYGTWINGVYCTGKEIDEINLELKNKYETAPLKVTGPDGKASFIEAEDLDTKVDFTAYLKDIKSRQNPYLWYRNLFDRTPEALIEPDLTYDEEKLNKSLSMLDFVKDHTKEPGHKVFITLTDEGYDLYNDNYEMIDMPKLLEEARKALFTTSEITVDGSFFYTEPYSEKETQIIDEWNSVSDYFSPCITLDMGDEQIVLDKKILSRFVSLSDKGYFLKEEDGKLSFSAEEIQRFIYELCDEYDTYTKPREYVTHLGKKVTIEKILYGTTVDREAMYEYVLKAINEGEKNSVYTPKYLHEAYHRGLNDIGPTYIEVDLEKQILYYIKNNEVFMECDVVTGKPSTPTPSMVCYVFSKSKDVTLRGTNYASHVNYWIPIYPTAGIGLHDASWQSEFGGERYKTHGSHGCVNMKKEDIKVLFDEIETGIPVILY